MEETQPLHLCHSSKSSLIINRLHIFFHGTALTALIYYRIHSLSKIDRSHGITFLICYILVFISELILSFLWLVGQSYRWRPVRRSAFPERLPGDDKLPAIDVFICTADPSREPSVDVMNTVISAMAMDYPPEKLNVYLNDDAGSSLTLKAMEEAWMFASSWLPFCRKYGVKTRCPENYFSGDCQDLINSEDFVAEKEEIQRRYELFTERVKWIVENTGTALSSDHPSRVEVIGDATYDSNKAKMMPLLVYVSREKRPFHHHNFKAGALNSLLRVSGVMSNSPYFLVLDCDMFCNDSSSARQAMCFHLDDNINSDLAFVQFPQKYRNISAIDIYDSQFRFFLPIQGYGADGIKASYLIGTGFYMKRGAVYGRNHLQKDSDMDELKNTYGQSDEFSRSTYQKKPRMTDNISAALIEETEFLASCSYEKNTKWGEETEQVIDPRHEKWDPRTGFRGVCLPSDPRNKPVGFQNNIIEDYCTSLKLCSEGWRSVYLDPSKPAFLGSATTNLSDSLVQQTRWYMGLFREGLSKHSPLTYGPSKGMSILNIMFYAQLSLYSLNFLPLWCLSIIPQICLLHGVPLYPTVLDPFFLVFAFVFISSNVKHAQEVLSDGLSIRSWVYEQRMWMIKSITCYTYGSLNAVLDLLGLTESSFYPTSKVADEEQFERYQSGIYDFHASTALIAPMCTLVILNSAAMLLGGFKVCLDGSFENMFVQIFIPCFVVTVQYPVIEGMLFRKDKGRIACSTVLLSSLLAAVVLVLGSLIF